MLRRAFPWSRKETVLNKKVFLRGEKTVLREKRIEDAPEDHAWRSDHELAGLDATRPLSMSYADFLRYSRAELESPNPRSKRLAIDTLDGKHIGNCMFYDIDLRRGEAEVGIMIGVRAYWGKGYGTDSVETLLRHMFTTASIRRIYLHTLEGNQRARRSFAKSGFREVKNVRRSGKDFVLMEVLRSEWEARRSSRQGESVEDSHLGDPDGPAGSSTGKALDGDRRPQSPEASE